MPLPNRQVGAAIVSRLPPSFDGFTVVGGTWKPKKTVENRPHKNEREGVFNVGFYNPGDLVTCQLTQKVTVPPTEDLQPSQTITEKATDDNPAPGAWLVMKADPTEFGTTGIVFDVELMRGDDLDLTQVTPA